MDDPEPIWQWIAVFCFFLLIALVTGWAYMAVTS